MKKVNIATGGSPVIGDYTLQLQDAIADALKGITSAYGNCIISGCVVALISGTNYSVSEGWLMWNGEVFHLPAQTIANPSAYPIVVFKTTSSITNPIAYADGLTKDLVVITEVNFKAAATALTGELLLTAFTPIANAIKSLYDSVSQIAWRLVPAHSTSEADKFESGVSVYDDFRYKHSNLDNVLLIQGRFSVVITSGDVTAYRKKLFTLPFGGTYTARIMFVTGAGLIIADGYIETTGEVFINTNDGLIGAGTFSGLKISTDAIPL